jgi:hypothetical protein
LDSDDDTARLARGALYLTWTAAPWRRSSVAAPNSWLAAPRVQIRYGQM